MRPDGSVFIFPYASDGPVRVTVFHLVPTMYFCSGKGEVEEVYPSLILGNQSGDNGSTAVIVGADNIAVGRSAGAALTTGGSNVFLGKQSGSTVATGGNNVILGGHIGSDALNAALILSDGAGTVRMRWDNARNAVQGLDTTAPTLERMVWG